jgi:hypothetical protein
VITRLRAGRVFRPGARPPLADLKDSQQAALCRSLGPTIFRRAYNPIHQGAFAEDGKKPGPSPPTTASAGGAQDAALPWPWRQLRNRVPIRLRSWRYFINDGLIPDSGLDNSCLRGWSGLARPLRVIVAQARWWDAAEALPTWILVNQVVRGRTAGSDQ